LCLYHFYMFGFFSFYISDRYMDNECMGNFTVGSLEHHEIVDPVFHDYEPNLWNSNSHETNICPIVDIDFDSIEDVKEFCTSFAKKQGFGVRIRSPKQNICTLVCANEGKHLVRNEMRKRVLEFVFIDHKCIFAKILYIWLNESRSWCIDTAASHSASISECNFGTAMIWVA